MFLHNTLSTATETWVHAIQQMMQSHLDNGTAVKASPTVTSTEDTAKGLAVIGRGVYYIRNS